MTSVTFSYVGMTLAILFIQCQRCEINYIPTLSCNETKFSSLTPAPRECLYGGSDDTYNYINCTKFRRSKQRFVWTLEMQLGSVHWDFHEYDEVNNKEQCCKLIFQWTGKTQHLENQFLMKFSSSLVNPYYAGTSNCNCDTENGRNCSFEVKLRDDVLALPPFYFTPDEPQFWDFSSPLFRADYGWLESLYLTGSLTEHYPLVLPGLAGSSIKELSVEGCFGTDQRGVLPHLDNLPRLRSLTFINSTRFLTEDNLPGIKKIKNLKLLKTKFVELPKVIEKLKDLETLTFESTMKNFTFRPETLLGLDSLSDLTLSGSDIEQWTIPYFRNLEVLNLSGCKIKRFGANGSHFKYPKLHQLNLSDNSLISLPNYAFTGVKHLNILDLSYNTIIQFPFQIFTPLLELEEIFLQGNNLTNWPIFPPSYFIKIDLSQNSLNHLKNVGNQLCFVSIIDISNNRISKWDTQNIFMKEINIFKCEAGSQLAQFSARKIKKSIAISTNKVFKPWTSRVNLSNNMISIFSLEMLASLSVLEEVDLGGNMIDCGDCKTSHLQEWLGSTKTNVVNLGQRTPLSCYQPPELKGLPVQDVNFDALCLYPSHYLRLVIGVPIAGVIAFVIIGGVIFYYRTEVAYLAHLAKVRASSKKTAHVQSTACYDAFVCYSGKNRKWVMRRLLPLLERRPESYALCLFDRDFRLGTHIVTNIVDAIEQSRKVIVVLTQKFIDSKWCQWELEMAQHKLFSEDREFLVLLELEPLERRRLPRLLRFLLDTRPVVRWPRPETAPAVMAAAAELRAVLGPSLRQRLLADPPPADEPGPSTAADDERTPLLAKEREKANY